ncbi:MAG TPA: HEAT repeat domain-containing protein [Blastocatellia bacterium]|nr:HEAT repeat domain-containing protein [Blastocatellia bacterium]
MKLGVLALTAAIAAGGAQVSSNRVKAYSLNVKLDKPVSVEVADQTQNFIRVEGSDLKNKMDAAIRRGRSESTQGKFWVAYSFDVRPGVAIDANFRDFDGNMNSVSGINVMTRSTHGVRAETPNLGIFLLHDKNENSGQTIQRVEIYNLDRSRDYSGYPVYWLDRASNRESLTFLKSLVESNNNSRTSDVAVLAIGVHDDPSVGGMLKDFINNSNQQKVRSTAVFWLGQIGGEEAFLSNLVQNEQEPIELRRQAAFSIGAGKSADALSMLHNLYGSVKETEVKKQLLFAMSINDDKKQSGQYLNEIATQDPSTELRKQAIFWLGQNGDDSTVDLLMGIYNADQNQEVKKHILFSLSQNQNAKARAKLYEIGRSANEPELRKQAVFWIGQQQSSDAVDYLGQLYSSEQNQSVREHIIFSLSQIHQKAAIQKLIDIAKNDPSVEMKKKAMFWLGQSQDPDALEFFKQILRQ